MHGWCTPNRDRLVQHQRVGRRAVGVPSGSTRPRCWPIRPGFQQHGRPIVAVSLLMLMLSIHPASTTHRRSGREAQQRAAGVLPDMIRMSVGLEHIDNFL